MKKENIFYLIFILTILMVRTGVFLFPQRKIIINGMLIHHFWIGMLLVLLVLLLPKKHTILRLPLISIGLGLVADELIYIVLGGQTVSEYWSVYSVLGAITMAITIFLIRKILVKTI